MRGSIPEPALARAWPWTVAFHRILREARPAPFAGSHLLFGSDYSGSHAGSRYQVYCFIVADADASPKWRNICRRVREEFLQDHRRMSFKSLNDGKRRRALVPFLEASESLTGHVLAVVSTKELAKLSTGVDTLRLWQTLHGLSGKWNPRAFEALARVAHFCALILAAWSRAGMHVSWITDDDEIVANEQRLDDTLCLSARFADVYVPHNLGEFMMNSVAVGNEEMYFEDFVAFPDLAAGMLAEVVTKWSSRRNWSSRGEFELESSQLTVKSNIIADWFWYPSESLR